MVQCCERSRILSVAVRRSHWLDSTCGVMKKQKNGKVHIAISYREVPLFGRTQPSYSSANCAVSSLHYEKRLVPFSRFDTYHETDRRTDGQTDGRIELP